MDEVKTTLTYTVTPEALWSFKSKDEIDFYSPAVRCRLEGEGNHNLQLWRVTDNFYSDPEAAAEVAKSHVAEFAGYFRGMMESAVRNLERVPEPFKRSQHSRAERDRYLYWKDHTGE